MQTITQGTSARTSATRPSYRPACTGWFQVAHRVQARHPRGFDLEWDAPVGRHMAVATEAKSQVRPNVSSQESHRPEFAKLTHMYKLMRHQPLVVT